MIFSGRISTPANTAKASLQRSTLKISTGLIYKMEMLFPPGPGGLLYVRFLHGSHPLFPVSQDTFFNVDDKEISYDEHYMVETDPDEITIETYNLDTAYPHSVLCIVAVADTEAHIAKESPSLAFDKLIAAIQSPSKEEAAKAQARLDLIRDFLGEEDA